MTAFARCEDSGGGNDVIWELRSVNHRYLEMQFRLPESWRHLEALLRERLKASLTRGKLDCTLELRRERDDEAFDLDQVTMDRLGAALRAVAQITGATQPVSALEILRWPGVLREPEQDVEGLESLVIKVFDATLAKLRDTRAREGAELATQLLVRLAAIERQLDELRPQLPALQAAQRSRMESRIAELKVDVDRPRLEQELVYFAQRMDVDEELDRLGVHLAELRRVLAGSEPCGRRLDFLLQEMNREANTLGSKASGLCASNAAIDIKVLIEQMREQVQNIE